MDRLKKSVLTSFIVLLILAVFSAGCVQPTEQDDSYVVGFSPDYQPYSYLDENGNPTGYSIETIQWMADQLGVKLTFKEVPWVGTLSSIASGDVDLYISHLVITPDRKQYASFSIPYGSADQAIAVKEGSSFTYDDFASGNMKIGVQGNTINSAWVSLIVGSEKYSEMVDNGRIILYETFPESMEAVDSGEVDCAVFDSLDVIYYCNNIQTASGDKLEVMDTVETMYQYGIAVNKDKPEVLEFVNEGLVMLLEDYPEKLEELKTKYQLTELE